jgi:hypothetical protein
MDRDVPARVRPIARPSDGAPRAAVKRRTDVVGVFPNDAPRPSLAIR